MRTTKLECDITSHAGDRTVIEGDALAQPFGWNLPDGNVFVICAADIAKPEALSELTFAIGEGYQRLASEQEGLAEAAVISHRAELRKRAARKS